MFHRTSQEQLPQINLIVNKSLLLRDHPVQLIVAEKHLPVLFFDEIIYFQLLRLLGGQWRLETIVEIAHPDDIVAALDILKLTLNPLVNGLITDRPTQTAGARLR